MEDLDIPLAGHHLVHKLYLAGSSREPAKNPKVTGHLTQPRRLQVDWVEVLSIVRAGCPLYCKGLQTATFRTHEVQSATLGDHKLWTRGY